MIPAPNPKPHAAKLKFKSSSIEWLVLSGASQAALKGSCTINREGGYEFLVSIIDGGAKGGGGEKIRVKIVNKVGACPLSGNPPCRLPAAASNCACAASSVHFALGVNQTPNSITPQPAGYRGNGV
jgi:hypothetical protein